eukprot:TRINITY_DN7003_c0_g1_i1.p1 TRINITY_DN7003_c0_g1~~TRINITY_DN7003_c0_g1_i1.p1  ORF type:complete len:615 (-),score=171.98 TRINITY_DN7003_c0_g1_i1:212-2056(-)
MLFLVLLAVNIVRAIWAIVTAIPRVIWNTIFKDELVVELYQQLQNAETYEQWCKVGAKLDEIEGNAKWKTQQHDVHYDSKFIAGRLNEMVAGKSDRDVHKMVFRLRADLLRTLGNLNHPSLYTRCHVGTKVLIESYLDEVVSELNYVCETEFDNFSLQEKFDFFSETRRSFGRTALVLSGGASFGMFHFGVIKCLFEQNLLPAVISGASVGSIIAALVCTRTDEELSDLWKPGALTLDVFDNSSDTSSILRKFNRLVNQGVLMDIEKFQAALRANIGDVTFQEAYERTGRVLNITVVSSGTHERPRLLNYLTAPHVLVASAACASCALSGLFAPVSLLARNALGDIVPYYPSELTWSDGSVGYDLPMQRLAELFNINHLIVSQVNPHVIPFLKASQSHARFVAVSLAAPVGGSTSLGSAFSLSVSPFDAFFSVVSTIMSLVGAELLHNIALASRVTSLPRALAWALPLLSQTYVGDITLVPGVALSDYLRVVSNPSDDYIQHCISVAERTVWPKLALVRNTTVIENTLTQCIARVRRQLQEEGSMGRTRSERNLASIGLSQLGAAAAIDLDTTPFGIRGQGRSGSLYARAQSHQFDVATPPHMSSENSSTFSAI